MRTAVFGLGLAQVGLTVAGALIGNMMLMAGLALLGQGWDLRWQARPRSSGRRRRPGPAPARC
jgi:hypothetical protein